eukprot:CAMPEP_0171142440 /NCGR_PEP_ID=MMETSP0766_2-20121228/142460_1 /TAXON_ID=439317 /ORGANISM="Gambierdiscus australes, Strain CAWD 149" /LENGTH=80 /DNA_ID=CAMNT_0011606225 /DNA_START=330 /DNA_END=568 /DNA_ORIENTATION=-
MVVRARVATKAVLLPALGALQARLLALLQCNAMGAVGRGARPEAAGATDSLLQAPFQEPLKGLLGQDVAQEAVTQEHAAL